MIDIIMHGLGIIVIIGMAIAFIGVIWDMFFNPKRCTCGAAGGIEWGRFWEHAPGCLARKD